MLVVADSTARPREHEIEFRNKLEAKSVGRDNNEEIDQSGDAGNGAPSIKAVERGRKSKDREKVMNDQHVDDTIPVKTCANADTTDHGE